MSTFDLFIDESGTFSEIEINRRRQDFANQLAGILVPVNELTEQNAEQILRVCYQKANFCNFPNVVHGTNISSVVGYDRLIKSLVSQIEQKRWQPVRLVNLESIDYGDRVSNYVNMLAELALRIYQQEYKKGASRITINFYCAMVSVSGEFLISER